MTRVIIPVRNEAARLGALLASLKGWDVVVVLDRCHDASEQIAREHGVEVRTCPAPFGKVEALREGMRSQADIYVCIDADVEVGPRTLPDLISALQDEHVLASCPPLEPVPSRWHTPLSWALYRYNRARGFSSERLWLSGRCYALRAGIAFPLPQEMAARGGPLLADDIWLSRYLLARDPRAIAHVETDPVRYRPPRTLRGMSRTYRRLRRELARIDRWFPELPGPGRDRRIDEVRGVDRVALLIFRAALVLCRAHAVLEDLAERAGHTPDPWPIVHESKR